MTRLSIITQAWSDEGKVSVITNMGGLVTFGENVAQNGDGSAMPRGKGENYQIFSKTFRRRHRKIEWTIF